MITADDWFSTSPQQASSRMKRPHPCDPDLKLFDENMQKAFSAGPGTPVNILAHIRLLGSAPYMKHLAISESGEGGLVGEPS